MSTLSNKIQSYSLSNGIEFNQAYALPPTQTGSNQSTDAANWTLTGNTPVSVSNSGPQPNTSSWKFSAGPTYGNASRIRSVGNVISSWNNGSFSTGVWFNGHQWAGIDEPGFIIHRLEPFGSNMGISYGTWSDEDANYGKKYIALTIANDAIYVLSVNGEDIVANKWYYLASRRNGTNIDFYINGTFQEGRTVTDSTGTNGTFLNFGTAANAIDLQFSFSNFYVASYAEIDATDIAEIWTAGGYPINITATPVTATTELVHPQISTQSDIVLSNQILSYSPEHYYQFNETPNYTTFNKPTNLGSYAPGTSTWNTTNLNASTVYLNNAGGVRGTGSWVFSYGGSTATQAALRGTTSQVKIWEDANFSIGYWFKTNFTLSNSLTHTTDYDLTNTGVNSTVDRIVTTKISGGGVNSINKGKLSLFVQNGTNVLSNSRVDDQQWHFVAIRFNGSSSGVYTEIYLDGVLLNSQTTTNQGSSTQGGILRIGDESVLTSGLNGAFELTSFEISDFYGGTYTSIGPTEIARLNAIADSTFTTPGVNASHTAAPITASTTLPMPTIVAVIGDSVNISTSFAISATFPTPNVGTGNNVIVNANVLTASALFTDNFGLITNKDDIFGADVFTAIARLSEPRVAEQPMKASATMPGGAVSVAPNYFTLVKNLNPLYYIENGLSTPVNYGTWTVNGYTFADIDTDVQSDEELNAIGNQKSWRANSPNSGDRPKLQGNITNYETLIENLYATRNLSIEVWYWSVGSSPNQESGVIFDDGVTKIAEVYDWYTDQTDPTQPLNRITLISDKIKQYDFDQISTAQWRYYPDANPKRLAWNHLVVTYEAVVDPNQIRRKIYLNGAIVGNETMTLSTTYGLAYFDPNFKQNANTFLGPNLGGVIQLSGSQVIKLGNGVKVDEFAIYPTTLSGSQVLDHHSFVRSLSPNTEFNHTILTATAAMGNHVVVPVQNTVYEVSPITALSILVNPTIVGGKSITIQAEPLSASALVSQPQILYGITYVATPAISYGELASAYPLNDIYYEYVQTNIAPYRYVTFDQADAYADYGTDADYSVTPTVVGGQIVFTDLGINGKSALTAGSNYTTDGVILKESEWNDSWGTGQNSYHSAFWFQRSTLDQSTTGLRVLWNLNGYKDNQHVVVYQYQNKIHAQFNNGSGTWVEQDTGTLDLFDYNPHFIVIEFDHTNVNNNVVKLYVDAVLKMTINLGSYTGTTTNAASADSGPNNEGNNRPRLSVGCLITPFGSTALPVVPTNTRLVVDEIYWDKNSITQTQVTNLYNKLPGKINLVNPSDAVTATALLVMPTFSLGINQPQTTYESLAQMVQPVVTADRSISNSVNPMLANATITNVQRSDSTNIVAQFMLASANFSGGGIVTRIDAAPLVASALLQDRRIPTGATSATNYPIKINGISTFDPQSAWVRYVLASTVDTMNLMKEVN
jgi:hypothetical protein